MTATELISIDPCSYRSIYSGPLGSAWYVTGLHRYLVSLEAPVRLGRSISDDEVSVCRLVWVDSLLLVVELLGGHDARSPASVSDLLVLPSTQLFLQW